MSSKAIFPFESFGFLLLFSYFNAAINANNILSHKELNFNKIPSFKIFNKNCFALPNVKLLYQHHYHQEL